MQENKHAYSEKRRRYVGGCEKWHKVKGFMFPVPFWCLGIARSLHASDTPGGGAGKRKAELAWVNLYRL